MPASLGSNTVSRFLHEPEANKLHLELVVETGQTVNEGDPVVLAANGRVQAAGVAAPNHTIIGTAVKAGIAGERVTIAMRAYCTVIAEAAAASFNAGPCQTGAWNATTGRREFAALTGATNHERLANLAGFNLTQAVADGDQVIVAMLD